MAMETARSKRVAKAFAHEAVDRTPIFEIFQPYHPIFWGICGKNMATDNALAWDAMADGVAWEELVEASAQAQYRIARFFDLDMVRLNEPPPRNYKRPRKIGPGRWTLDGVEHVINERTMLIEKANPGNEMADSNLLDEEEFRKSIERWDGQPSAIESGKSSVLSRVRELAEKDGANIVFMGEVGAGTGVAFYPPFMLMWLAIEPELVTRWMEMQKATAFPRTKALIESGCQVMSIGGDVSSDKGPFLSPDMYHEFILPTMREHVRLIHEAGAMAVYTSDGNHWPIKEDFFFNSGIDGYKEVDKAAGMTWPRLIEECIDKRVCIIGNLDARHTLCHASPADVRREVFECLRYGQASVGGHILHSSHSVHEDVKVENYFEAVAAYRDFFGLEKLPAIAASI